MRYLAAMSTGAASSRHARPRVAILTVNGFARRGRWAQQNLAQALRYPWIDLCLRQVQRCSREWDYEVFVLDNSHLRAHRQIMRRYPHVRVAPGEWVAALGRAANRLPLRHVGRLLERSHPTALDHLARKVPAGFDYIVTLDNDSFPVREDWLDVMIGACEDGAAVSGVYRDEMAPAIHPFIHVSGFCARLRDVRALNVSFGRELRRDGDYNQDVGQKITYEFKRLGRTIAPLRRSNSVNYHFLIGGVYGDVIYHHGAGSRQAIFWTPSDRDADERVSATLRDVAFADLDHLIAVLRGAAANDLGLQALAMRPPAGRPASL
jgi:hypothetical protein